MRSTLGLITIAAAAAAPVKVQSGVDVVGWQRGSRVTVNKSMDVIIALKNANMDKLESEIMAVSSPRSERYGQHLTREEVSMLTSPSQDVRQEIQSWLTSNGVQHEMSPRGDRLKFRASVQDIERLFSTEVHEYTSGDRSVMQARDLFAPSHVASGVGAVFGLHGTPLERRPVHVSTTKMHPVTPDLLKDLYNVTGVTVSRGSQNRRATAEFQGQYTSQADLTAFFEQYVSDYQAGDELYTCGAGQCEPDPTAERHQGPGTEAQLDIQYIAGVAPGIKNEVWSYQAMAWCTDLKEWTSDLLDAASPPQVFSVSYGIQGNVSLDKNQGCSEEITRNIEDDFAKIAARGVSILVSSGDSGSGGSIIPFTGQLWPSWPASAPHVSAVGATKFINDNDVTQGERATTQFGSGGGFDCRWDAQDWQKADLEEYLARPEAGLPKDKDFCRGGRGTPEVAALGEGYQVINSGSLKNVGGTSASSPLFAGLISLLNEYRLQNGQSPLGFLNPLLYDMAHAAPGSFWDVTVGNNRLDESAILPLTEGYSCTEGWDAVTGFGTPNFARMLEYVKQLPSGRRSDVVV
jgi:tripeptidyl-peptidase-1